MDHKTLERRGLISGLAAAVAAVAAGTRRVAAQTASAFQPARHAEDEWLDKVPGKHRIVLDTTSAKGMPDMIRFVGNLYDQNKAGYGLEESDLAIVVVLRHSATAFGYTDAIWGKHAAQLVNFTSFSDARATEAPKGNPYNAAPRSQLDGLAKRGVQFMVCATASRGISRMLAGQGGDADAKMKEMAANLIPSARLVPAGVIGVTRAQEFGYKLIYAG